MTNFIKKFMGGSQSKGGDSCCGVEIVEMKENLKDGNDNGSSKENSCCESDTTSTSCSVTSDTSSSCCN